MQGLKRQKGSVEMGLAGVLAVYLLGRVKVREARRYLDGDGKGERLHWSKMGDLEMAELASKAEEWVQRERRKGAEGREQHQERTAHLQRILPELKRLLPDCPPHPNHPHLRQLITRKLALTEPNETDP